MKTTRLKCLMPVADIDATPVRSSAFRRFGWATVFGRLKAELQTKLHVYMVAVSKRALPVLVALFFVVVSVLHAQSYSINWSKVAGGGGTSAGGAYQVSGTIGQHDAGGPMTGGNYSLTGGFWSVITVVQTPGAPRLTISFNSPLPTVTVSWPSSATNYVLQQNSNLMNTANWINTGLLITTNGATESVTISQPAGNLFFRLTSP